ncbi:MAG: phosphoadenosine phosphosulfate reductase family protein [Eubacterium sp.]
MGNLLFDPIKTQSKITDAVLVGFSGGKDSIVTLDMCVKYFKTVVPFFMYLAPDLEFQERTVQKYEKKYNIEIIRLPHFEVSNFFRYGTFRNADPSVKIVSITDVYEYLRQKTGIEWIAAGERTSDSIVRNAMIKKSGSVDKQRRRFYPIAYWNKANVMKYIKMKNLYLPQDSRKIGFSFRSLAGEELSTIKNLYPKDYEKILKVYPFAGASVERFECYGK